MIQNKMKYKEAAKQAKRAVAITTSAEKQEKLYESARDEAESKNRNEKSKDIEDRKVIKDQENKGRRGRREWRRRLGTNGKYLVGEEYSGQGKLLDTKDV